MRGQDRGTEVRSCREVFRDWNDGTCFFLRSHVKIWKCSTSLFQSAWQMRPLGVRRDAIDVK